MRFRTMVTLSAGAAVGAGAMYLLDPDHGASRRRDARRSVARSAREGAFRVALDAKRRTSELAVSALAGYQQARVEQDPTRAV